MAKRYQGYVAEGAGTSRSTRAKQLHIRVTDDQLVRFQLAAERSGVTLSRWAIEHLTKASAPNPDLRRLARAERILPHQLDELEDLQPAPRPARRGSPGAGRR